MLTLVLCCSGVECHEELIGAAKVKNNNQLVTLLMLMVVQDAVACGIWKLSEFGLAPSIFAFALLQGDATPQRGSIVVDASSQSAWALGRCWWQMVKKQ